MPIYHLLVFGVSRSQGIIAGLFRQLNNKHMPKFSLSCITAPQTQIALKKLGMLGI